MLSSSEVPCDNKHQHDISIPSAHLAPLTGLRFIAALGVVCCHFGVVGVSARTGLPYFLQIAAHNFTSSGWIGVNFFFLLSGFILAYTYLGIDGKMRGTRRAFWIARFARIYPVYLPALLVAVGPFLWLSHPRVAIGEAAATLTLTQAWIPHWLDWNGPGWTLSCETFFYLMFPFVSLPIMRLNRRWFPLLIGSLWGASLISPVLYLIINPDGFPYSGTPPNANWIWVLYYNPLGRLPEFLMGVALGWHFVSTRTNANMTSLWRSKHRGAFTLLASAVAGGALVLSPWMPLQLLHSGLLDPVIALVIYNIAWAEGSLATLFALPAMTLLGESSYALYILHVPFWRWMERLLYLPIGETPPNLVYFLDYLCLAIAISLLTRRLVEQPARRLIRRAWAGS